MSRVSWPSNFYITTSFALHKKSGVPGSKYFTRSLLTKNMNSDKYRHSSKPWEALLGEINYFTFHGRKKFRHSVAEIIEDLDISKQNIEHLLCRGNQYMVVILNVYLWHFLGPVWHEIFPVCGTLQKGEFLYL